MEKENAAYIHNKILLSFWETEVMIVLGKWKEPESIFSKKIET